ncbi:MAG: hypothetical protein N3E45_00325 [Oscillatoriaceae bacterium SKW80]|nr:hypothetical protein [Oscillatoriaceae bacterium SKYG93]MCX8119274.1 hypothetical protein [Oscillatoriaceae bacterium SKW80]MDW8454741.1 hypothetical protein [Oscillatoriaceae cyanobacterium SKYGB_i_bin93]HIK28478.1 hypothetical protein [Oscillatoriaceae cyanobacterium M7585_C2015_266]
MKPRIKNILAWQQAELLMQPALIRLIDNLRKKLEESVWQGTYEEVQFPIPGFQLCLQHQNHQVKVNMWELCYQICFSNYRQSHAEIESVEVDIDTSLIDETTGDVDWNRIDEKAKQVVEEVFASLPACEA